MSVKLLNLDVTTDATDHVTGIALQPNANTGHTYVLIDVEDANANAFYAVQAVTNARMAASNYDAGALNRAMQALRFALMSDSQKAGLQADAHAATAAVVSDQVP